MMFDNDMIDEVLAKKYKHIIEKVGRGETLSAEDTNMLILKAQTNHFHHLDIELREDMQNLRSDLTNDMQNLRIDLTNDMQNLRSDLTNDMKNLREDLTNDMKNIRKDMNQRFESVDKRFESVDKRFEMIVGRMDRLMFWTLGLTLSSTAIIIGFIVKFV